ncbi:flippase [Empedobacter sedimenti]|uniref:flippase n=1 Tax=Empedobacter sedimenti TaxID=3042610 RepID=UPI0024A63D36|nr:flippase [Empedobacter sedimenti]
MKVRNIKVNYLLNITRTLVTTLIGLIIFPYINRVLGVQNIGKYEYANSIITYFLLFSALGIPMYGIRAIAKVRDNLEQRTKVLVELMIILIIVTLISYMALFTLMYFLPILSVYQYIILVLSPSILFTNLGVEWFYQGVEDQKYITIRTIVVKLIMLLLVFLLVTSKEDYILYGLIITLSIVVSNIFNLFYLRKYIDLSSVKFKDLKYKAHLQGILTIFLATISISIYLQLDNTLLGYFAGDKHVGVYSTANKLVRFAILFVTTLGSVMLPRLSYLYENKQYDNYRIYLDKTLKYILFFSVPASLIIFSLSKEIIFIMAGNEFVEAILPMQILSFLVFIVGIAYYLAFMVLYPQGKEKYYTIIVFISALISFGLNLIFIPKYQEISTSLIALLVEIFGVVLMLILTRKFLVETRAFNRTNLNYFFAGGVLTGIIYLVTQLDITNFLTIVFSLLFGGLGYLISLYLLKDQIVLELMNDLSKRIKKV